MNAEPTISACPVCHIASAHPNDTEAHRCGNCGETVEYEPVLAPVGIRIVYHDGTVLEPDGLRYAGFYARVPGEQALHRWVARLPRPLRPGLAEVTLDMLPALTEVTCE